MNLLEKRLLSSIDEGRAIKLLADLVKIPSPNPPGDARDIAHFLERTMREKGLHADLYPVEENYVSVVVRIKGTGGGKSLLLNSHIDTVPIGDRAKWTLDPLSAEVQNGKMYGRGSTDCKSGVAAMILAAEALAKSQVLLKGDVILTLVAGEETLSDKGTAYLLNQGLVKADGAIVAEPTTLPSEDSSPQPLQIFIASRGMAWLEITVEGKSVHAKIAPSGINAIEKMAKIVLALQNIRFDRGSEHPFCGMPTLNVGIIAGGTSPNIVPDYCSIKLDRDIVPGENPGRVIDEIIGVIDQLKAKDKDLKATITRLLTEDPVEISKDEPIVKTLNQSIKAALGVEAKIGGMIGTNDSRFLIKKGIPTVVCGPGISTQSHNIDEYVEINAIVNAAKAYALLMSRFCG